MGFMKFMHKKGKDKHPDKNELDIPPLPPPVDGLDDLNIGSLGGDIKLPEQHELPPFPEESETTTDMPELPELPPLPEKRELTGAPVQTSAPIQAAPQLPETHIEAPRIEPMPIPKNIEKAPLQGKPIFIKVENYKDMLGDLSNIKSDLKKAHDALALLEEQKQEEDKEFNKWHSCLEDMHNKLSMMDKILTSGGL